MQELRTQQMAPHLSTIPKITKESMLYIVPSKASLKYMGKTIKRKLEGILKRGSPVPQ